MDDQGQTSKLNSREDRNDRNLWFQYLSTLNDRHLESTRAAQPTTWVLVGLAAAIIYKSIPLIPTWLAEPNSVRQGATLLALQLDFMVGVAFALGLLVAYCSHDSEGRVLPEQGKRIQWVLISLGLFSLATLACGHFALAYVFSGPRFVRWILVSCGALWGLILTGYAIRLSNRVRQGKRLQFQIPFFSSSPSLSTSFVVVGLLLCGILFGITLVSFCQYLRYLASTPSGWVTDLSAATRTLVLLLVGFILLGRVLTSVSMEIYNQLEREVVLGALTIDEIRIKFVTQALGPSVTEWFQDLNRQYLERTAKLKEICDVTSKQLEEIEKVDVQYRLERKGRAERLLKEFRTSAEEQLNGIKAILSQVTQFVATASASPPEMRMLSALTAEWNSRSESLLETGTAGGSIRTRLETLSNS